MSEQTNAARINELNATIRYTMWSVFRAQTPLPPLREEMAGAYPLAVPLEVSVGVGRTWHEAGH